MLPTLTRLVAGTGEGMSSRACALNAERPLLV